MPKTLAESLQGAYQKVNEKLGRQEKSLKFKKRISTRSNTIGLPDTETDDKTVTIQKGCKVGRVQRRNMDSSGVVRFDDLQIEIPAHLITEDQLDDSIIEYKSKIYSIVTYFPQEIFSSTVTQWIVIARIKS